MLFQGGGKSATWPVKKCGAKKGKKVQKSAKKCKKVQKSASGAQFPKKVMEIPVQNAEYCEKMQIDENKN